MGNMRLAVISRSALLCAAALAVCISGCESVHDPSLGRQAAPVYLADGRPVTLLPPSAITTPIESYQQIEGSYRDRTFLLDVFVHADSESLTMEAFDSFGTRVFELEYRGSTVRFISAFPDRGMKPEYVLEDFQLCCYPAAALRGHLAAAGLTFQEDADAGQVVRKVSVQGRQIIEIRRTPGEIHYSNILRGYQYLVRSE